MIAPRYYRSQVFDSEDALSYEQAVQKGTYLKCYYTDESRTQIARAEVIRHTETEIEIRKVIYYDQPLPHTQIKHQHRLTYPDIPFEAVLPLITTDGETVRTSHFYAATGELRYIKITYWNKHHYIESRKDAQGNFIGHIETQYDGQGHPLVSREYNGDGTLISEDFD